MVAGKGGFIASDLSGYARTHTIEQIESAIVEPTGSSNRQIQLVTATLRSGEKYIGRIRNEDNFSLQLQALDGTFYFLSKSDLDGLKYNQPLMPSDYATKLTPDELKGIVSYLISVANTTKPEAREKLNEEE